MNQTRLPKLLCLSLTLLMPLGMAADLHAEEPEGEPLQRDKPETAVARLALANELMRIHWTAWVTDDQHARVVKNTIHGINDEIDNTRKIEWLVPNVVATKRKLDDFETSAIDAIRAGEPEIGRAMSSSVQVLLPVRAKTSCLKCHTALRSPNMPLQEGDLLGIASVLVKP